MHVMATQVAHLYLSKAPNGPSIPAIPYLITSSIKHVLKINIPFGGSISFIIYFSSGNCPGSEKVK